MPVTLTELQENRLRKMFTTIFPANSFYQRKFGQAGLSTEDVHSLTDLARLPLTTKAELLADQKQNPPYGTNLTYPCDALHYSRMHQTSGTTTGQPLRWLDTKEGWQWSLECWRQIFAIAGVRAERDRLFFPFSFGPFLGFWSAWESAADQGFWMMSGGGMTSAARLRFLLDHQATVILCTPTYALHLVEVAKREELPLRASAVEKLIVAGEPGGSIPGTRQQIEQGWGARVIDHSGMTEIGPVAVECEASSNGLHVLESEYVFEVIHPETGESVEDGHEGELVLTNLGRLGSPLIRYRTGDLVVVDVEPCPCGRTERRLKGGILGRADDMIHLRGNNVHPSALEAILRRFVEVVEFRMEFDQREALAKLRIEIEPVPEVAVEELQQKIDQTIRDELLFRAEIKMVAPGSLPRYEMKAKRFSRIRE